MTLAVVPDAPVARSPIPETVDDLHQLADLAFASNWLLAATVWVWTYETKGRPKSGNKLPLYTISEFADLGVRGLTSRPAVRKYRNAWQQALDRGLACSVQAGETPELPELPFGDTLTEWRNEKASQDAPASTESDATPISGPRHTRGLTPNRLRPSQSR